MTGGQVLVNSYFKLNGHISIFHKSDEPAQLITDGALPAWRIPKYWRMRAARIPKSSRIYEMKSVTYNPIPYRYQYPLSLVYAGRIWEGGCAGQVRRACAQCSFFMTRNKCTVEREIWEVPHFWALCFTFGNVLSVFPSIGCYEWSLLHNTGPMEGICELKEQNIGYGGGFLGRQKNKAEQKRSWDLLDVLTCFLFLSVFFFKHGHA